MRLLSHPFRLDPSGAVATVEDDTEDAHAEAIAIMILTRRGERELVPGFGITDPTFSTLSLAEINTALETYDVGVEVDVVEVEYPTATTERVVISFNEIEE